MLEALLGPSRSGWLDYLGRGPGLAGRGEGGVKGSITYILSLAAFALLQLNSCDRDHMIRPPEP